jgi:hypothetical protein
MYGAGMYGAGGTGVRTGTNTGRDSRNIIRFRNSAISVSILLICAFNALIVSAIYFPRYQKYQKIPKNRKPRNIQDPFESVDAKHPLGGPPHHQTNPCGDS